VAHQPRGRRQGPIPQVDRETARRSAAGRGLSGRSNVSAGVWVYRQGMQGAVEALKFQTRSWSFGLSVLATGGLLAGLFLPYLSSPEGDALCQTTGCPVTGTLAGGSVAGIAVILVCRFCGRVGRVCGVSPAGMGPPRLCRGRRCPGSRVGFSLYESGRGSSICDRRAGDRGAGLLGLHGGLGRGFVLYSGEVGGGSSQAPPSPRAALTRFRALPRTTRRQSVREP
jgi:hypothetical protein